MYVFVCSECMTLMTMDLLARFGFIRLGVLLKIFSGVWKCFVQSIRNIIVFGYWAGVLCANFKIVYVLGMLYHYYVHLFYCYRLLVLDSLPI